MTRFAIAYYPRVHVHDATKQVLGCTAPHITVCDAVVFVADGRFHPEAVLVANPSLPLYRYDPYSKTITRERYDHDRMHSLRRDAVCSDRF